MRPAVAMFLAVAFLKEILVLPMVTVRFVPSVRKTILAGTCSVSPRRFAA